MIIFSDHDLWGEVSPSPEPAWHRGNRKPAITTVPGNAVSGCPLCRSRHDARHVRAVRCPAPATPSMVLRRTAKRNSISNPERDGIFNPESNGSCRETDNAFRGPWLRPDKRIRPLGHTCLRRFCFMPSLYAQPYLFDRLAAARGAFLLPTSLVARQEKWVRGPGSETPRNQLETQSRYTVRSSS